MMNRWLKPQTLIVAAGGVIAIMLLFLKPFIGVADNGDFERIMNTVGLNYYVQGEAYEDRFFSFSHSRFALDEWFRGFYPTSQLFVLLLPRLLGGLINGTYFDIRLLGAVYALLLLAAVWLLVKLYGETQAGGHASGRLGISGYGGYRAGGFGGSGWSRREGFSVRGLLLGAALLFVFFDIGYLAYFNSLFGEPVSMIFMLLTFAFGLKLAAREEAGSGLLVLLFVAALFLGSAKIQNAPLGLAFALIFLRFAALGKREGDGRFRRLALGFAAALALASTLLYAFAPKELKHINLYQTVFFGILNESPDVRGDLQDLGLPEHLEVLAGTNYFQSGTAIPQNDPSLQSDFYDRVSHKDVLFFYLSHPSRLIAGMEYAAENAMMIRPYYLGSFEKAEGKPPGALSFQYSGWSEFKKNALPNSLLFLTLFYVLYYAVALFHYFRTADMRRRIAIELYMLIGLIGIFSFMVPILGDGRADIGKHLFMFNVSFDMMLIVMFGWLLNRAAGLLRR